MSKHKFINLICVIIVAIAVIITVVIMAVKSGQDTKDEGNKMEYETKLFDTDMVHSIDIQIDQSDWEKLQANASEKEYMKCDIVVDGETFQNVAIRAKGNSSLSQVKQEGSERYSFKIEFDHYNDANTLWGLDKLSLNNIIQDATYMKDYLSYTLMREMQANAPLCSYISVKVNGEDFGLYLAVEGVEESFVERNYGSDFGNLYKPETMDMANMGDFNMGDAEDLVKVFGYSYGNGEGMPDFSQLFKYGYGNGQGRPDNMQGFGGKGGGGMFGSGDSGSDVALKYTDDDISSYSNIFNGVILDATKEDKKRLISSIKQMNSGENLDEVLNVDEILRYFVVHNFVNNYDSYTGSMLHNFYLYEKDGKISMIAWDYNLSFGGFTMGQGMGIQSDTSTETSVDTATKYVNYPIDTPVSSTTMEDRPLLNNLLTNDEYLEKYHELFQEFITAYFDSGYTDALIDKVSSMIEPYVEKDKTAFYTVDEFKKGVSTLKEFCSLRADSIKGQLRGIIPSTTDGQQDTSTLIDASSINIEDMGSAGGTAREGGLGGFGGGNFGGNNRDTGDGKNSDNMPALPADGTIPDSYNMPVPTEDGTVPDFSNMPAPPDDGTMPDRSNIPEGYQPDFSKMPNMKGGKSGTDNSNIDSTDTNALDNNSSDTKPADTSQIGKTSDINKTAQGNQNGNAINKMGFGNNTNQASGTNMISNIIILGVSVLILFIGLVWLKLYRRKKY